MLSRLLPAWLLVIVAVTAPRIWIAKQDWQRDLGLWRDNVYVRAGEQYHRDGPFTGGLAMRPVERELDGEKTFYTNHPPLYPLSIGVSFALFGESFWAARAPELAASLLLVLMLWNIATRADEDLEDVSLHAAALLAVTPGLVMHSISGDVVGTMAVFGEVAVIWSYLGYRHAMTPVSSPLFVIVAVTALFIDWLTLFATAACLVHLLTDRERPASALRTAAATFISVSGLFALLVLFYMAPGGGLTGVVALTRGVLFHSMPAAWTAGGFSLSGLWPVLAGWRRMLMLPVAVLGIWELVFQPEDPRPNGLRTACRLLLATTLLHVGIYLFGSLQAHEYLGLPLVTLLSFAAAIKLVRFRSALISWSALAVLIAGGVFGIRGQVAKEQNFYAPRIVLYRDIAAAVRQKADGFPSTSAVTIGTNAWVPRGFEASIAPNLRLVRVGDPATIPFLNLDGFLAVKPPQGMDLTPTPYERIEAAPLVAALGAAPQTAALSWIPLPPKIPVITEPSGETAPDTPAELSVSVTASRGLTLVFSPDVSLPDSVIAVFDRVYRGDELLREGGKRLSVSRSADGVALDYRERFDGETRYLDYFHAYPVLAGSYLTDAIRVHQTTLDGRKAVFICPLPGPEKRSCRRISA